MVFRRIIPAVLIAAALAVSGAVSQQPEYFSVPAIDAPELAHRGPHTVGVRTIDLVNPGQVDILKFDKEAGKAPSYDRPLKIEIWYPGVVPAGAQEHTVYKSPLPRPGPSGPAGYETAGKALRDAASSQDGPFPLVVVSHGYPGTRFFMSYLTENLASKGYVVAAIDHTDSVFGDVKPFVSTLLNRASDQLFTIDALAQRARSTDDFLHGVARPNPRRDCRLFHGRLRGDGERGRRIQQVRGRGADRTGRLSRPVDRGR
jgi:predicted dienelactone hydrolase